MYMCFPAFAIQQCCLIQMLLFPENAWISALLWEAFVSHRDSAFYCLYVSKQPKGTGMSKKPAKGLAEPIIQWRLLFISGTAFKRGAPLSYRDISRCWLWTKSDYCKTLRWQKRYSKYCYLCCFGVTGVESNGETERLHPGVVMRIFLVWLKC